MEKIKEEQQYALARVQALEPAFLELRERLTPQQQTALDDYIAACEALTEAETLLQCLQRLTEA